jgi:hypothetical protein
MEHVYTSIEVLEELLKRIPKLGGSGVIVGDNIEQLGGDADVDLLDERQIILQPTWFAWLRH